MEVGLEDILEAGGCVEAILFGGTKSEKGKVRLGVVTLIHSKVGRDDLWAVGDKCEPLFSDPTSLVAPEKMRGLQILRKKSDFIAELKKHDLYLAKKDSAFAMVLFKGGSLNGWEPPKEFQGWQKF